MTDLDNNVPATVPDQPAAESPVKKSKPVVIALVVILVLIGIANLSSLLTGSKKSTQASSLTLRPSTANAHQVSSFETQQQMQARRDADERQRQQELQSALQQLQSAGEQPGPESGNTPLMTSAQRDAMYGNSPNAPVHTSNASQVSAEAKQRALLREKQRQDAINSGTVALDFARQTSPTEHETGGSAGTAAQNSQVELASNSVVGHVGESSGNAAGGQTAPHESLAQGGDDPLNRYPFDQYQGKLYRVFEGTVLEGVVTNRIDGGLSGPILVMLTTDYYSHDHQQLLMPQGTRLIGTVQSVGNAQQRKMFVTFHRAVCPDGFSIDFDKYIGLDPLGTTGLATNIDHGYLQVFAAAAAVGGLGGLAQAGNSGSVLDSSTQIRNGISEQTATEGEQILNHFLNRLPVITLKEGSRARIYVGRDILVPSYAEHRVDPTL